MSHIVQIQTEVRDPIAIRSACDRLKLPAPTQGSHRLFSGKVVGLGVELPNWRYESSAISYRVAGLSSLLSPIY